MRRRDLAQYSRLWRLLKQKRRLMIVGEGPMDAQVRQDRNEHLNVEWLRPQAIRGNAGVDRQSAIPSVSL